MDEITSPVPEPVPPELAEIDAYLTDALRVPPLDAEAAQVMAQAVMRRGENVGTRSVGSVGAGFLRSRNADSRTRTLRWWSLAVGSVAAVVVAGMFNIARMNGAADPGTTTTYATTVDQQANLTLNDGTRVTLAPQTVLHLVHFGHRWRTVTVDHGEVYFDVAHASGAPFVVRSGGVAAQVLGTEFLIRHRAGEPVVRIAVADGKVRVTTQSLPDTAVMLTAGHIGDVTASGLRVRTLADSTTHATWVRGRLVFDDAPVAIVLQTLSQWYGYQFRCADSTLLQKSVTIGLSMQSSATALAKLEQILLVSLTVRGDTITLTPRPIRPAGGMPRIRAYDIWTPTREIGR